MAVAEARAAWQRTANRCFVQEDAKRAPKLACCPSASALSKQVDSGAATAEGGQDTPTIGFLPLNGKPSYSNLSPDSRWWLQTQPNYGYQRGLTNETSKVTGVHVQNQDDGGNVVDDNMNVKLSPGIGTHDIEAVNTKISKDPLKLEDSWESYVLMEMDPIGCSVSKQPNEFYFDPECPWIVGDKTEPWWRTADKDELAMLVAKRSLALMENSDLPQPHNTCVKDPCTHFGCSNCEETFPSSRDGNSTTGGCPKPTVLTRCNLNSGSAYVKRWASVEQDSHHGIEKPFSESNTCNAVTKTQISESNPRQGQLLEALCHSQTRAREAEKAIKQAYAEKEHIVKLFFRQASHLFAYKQWFQLLQLEDLCFQVTKNSNHPISSLFPVVLPWMPRKTQKLRKRWQKAAKARRAKRDHHSKCYICKYAVVFALGLGLVGAGLLLGWTVGWMLPAFEAV